MSRWQRLRARRWFRITAGIFGVIAAYLVIGNVLHRWVFPQPAPDPSTYPRVGDVLENRVGGTSLEIVAIDGDRALVEVTMAPHASGPPLHFHAGFSETFEVVAGTLSIQLADRVLELGPGESYTVEPHTAHRPFNATGEPVTAGRDRAWMPLSFAACLVQLYDFVDKEPSKLAMAMKVSVIDPICDTHLADVPGPARAITGAFLAPVARLLGYRNYDPNVALHPPGQSRASASSEP